MLTFSVLMKSSYRNSSQCGNTAAIMNTGIPMSSLDKVELAYTGRFDLNPDKNTRQSILLPLKDIKELQQDGVYLAIMQKAGSYSYQFPATVFTLSDIGVSLHSYHDRVDIFTQSLVKVWRLKASSYVF